MTPKETRELLRQAAESLVVTNQLLECSTSVIDQHHAKQSLAYWTPIWKQLEAKRYGKPVTANTVRALREATGQGIMDCKKALERCDGHHDDAVEYLRVLGNIVASKADKAPGWIKSSAQLPEVGQMVLVLMRSGDVRLGARVTEYPGHEDNYQPFDYWDDFHDEGQGWEDHDIVAWQPVPIVAPGFLQSIANEDPHDPQ